MNTTQIEELLLQSLEHERASANLYVVAIECASDPGLKHQWEEYLADARNDAENLGRACAALGLDCKRETPGRAAVREIGRSLGEAMRSAASTGETRTTELTACECILLNETKSRLLWELLGRSADVVTWVGGEVLRSTCVEAKNRQSARFQYAQELARDVWLDALELGSTSLPPEDRPRPTPLGTSQAE